MSIWFKNYPLEALNALSRDTMIETLGIIVTEIGEDHLTATLPVDKRTHQPAKLLHGGASAALAETLGSLASYLVVNPDTHACVGLELNINHIRGERAGTVTGTAKPVHIGKSTHLWNIEIRNEEGRLVAVSRLTMMILDKK